jgi:hypothetical protein
VKRCSAALVLVLAGCVAVPEPVITEPEPSYVEPLPVQPEPVVAVDEPLPDPLLAPVPVEPPRADGVTELIADFQRLRKLPASELSREQEAARLAFAQSRSDRSRVRLAMTLSVPGSAANDEIRALELLEPVAKNPASDLQPLAALLGSYIVEQRRLLAQLQGLQQNVNTLQQNLQASQQNVQTLQGNVQALQQKLDALKTLERTLTERRQGGAPVRR